MSIKIAAEECVRLPPPVVVVVREYDEERDKVAVEELEGRCEFGQGENKPTLVTDLLGDPIRRVRDFPLRIMLVAEHGEKREIVGTVRGGIKTVIRSDSEGEINLAYVLGLRVSPSHRRLGIGTKLVHRLEEWCKENGADYSYMATDCNNKASINLFTLKCGYVKFRNPSVLVHPVHAHSKPVGSGIEIVQISAHHAKKIYRALYANSEFFPKDFDDILDNKLNLGTFMAIPKKFSPWNFENDTLLPPSYAILSVWNTKDVYRFQVRGASTLTYAYCLGSRIMDKLMPWLRLPSIPNFFKQFGVYFLYGLHMEGEVEGASRLMKALCAKAHNMAGRDIKCRAVVAEVGHGDPLRKAIPHWSKFSWDEDLWCMKKIGGANQQEDKESCGPYDWVKSGLSMASIFVDPRDF